MKKLLVILVMLVAMNANAQWVQVSNGMGTNKSVNALAVNGSTIYAGTDSSGVYISTNNGTSWTQTSLNNVTTESLLISGTNIFAGTRSNGVYLSTNGGTNWIQTSLNNKSVKTLAANGNTIFAGIFESVVNGIYLSTNNGINCIQTSIGNITVYSIAVIGGNIFAGTVGSYGYPGGVFISTNNGVNWSLTSLNNSTVQCLVGNGNKIFAAVDFFGVYLSTNNGVNWTQTALNYTYGWSFASYGNNVFTGTNYVNSTNNGGVFQTSNNGANWVHQNQGLPSYPSCSALLIANNYIYTGLYMYSVWRHPLSELIGIQNIGTEIPSKYSLSQNYPNPFNPITNVKFSIINSGQVKLIVYDVMGREVQTLVNEKLQPGTYEAAFDGSMQNSGVYFYKLIVRHGGSSTDGFSETKKMLLIK